MTAEYAAQSSIGAVFPYRQELAPVTKTIEKK